MKKWEFNSWENFEARHLPEYNNKKLLNEVKDQISVLENLQLADPQVTGQGAQADHRVLRELHEAIRNEQPTTVRLLNYKKSGERFLNELTVDPLRDDRGGVVAVAGHLGGLGSHGQAAPLEQQPVARGHGAEGEVAGPSHVPEAGDRVVDVRRLRSVGARGRRDGQAAQAQRRVEGDS